MKPKSAPDPHLQKNFQIKIPPPFTSCAFFHKTDKQPNSKNINILNSKKFF